MGVFARAVICREECRPHKKADVVLGKKSFPRGRVNELELRNRRRAARSKTQMNNLLNGVVTRSLAATDATSAKVGACGTKLLNGLSMNTIGRPVYGFPSGSPQIQQDVSYAASANVYSSRGAASRRLVGS